MTRNRHVCALTPVAVGAAGQLCEGSISAIGPVSCGDPSPSLEPVAFGRVSPPRPTAARRIVKTQLKELRALAETRLKSGAVPGWSWPQHVQLIEAVDAMLHDLSVAETAVQARHYSGKLRLVSENSEQMVARRKSGSMH